VAETAGAGAIPAGTTVLVGRDAGADALAGLAVGDEVAVSHELRYDGAELATALGGNVTLLEDGEVVPHTDPAAHPRTAIGFDEDGDTAYLVSIDGRIAQSRGMTYTELGGFLKELGADDALNLDGGGSSTMLAREAGEDDLDVENTPSDGSLRPVPNGLGLFAAEGSGRLDGLRVVPAADEEDEDLLRVFPGLTRRLDALGHDETLAPVATNRLTWRSTDVQTGSVRDGVVTGKQPGPLTVEARDRRVTGSLDLEVLEPLDRIRPSVDTVNLPDADARGSFRIIGADRGGFEAPLEPTDVELDYDESAVTIEPDGAGGWDVTPLTETASVVVTATVQGQTTSLGITVGVEERVLADFDGGIDGWTFGSARGSGSLVPAEGEDGSGALTIDYDFTASTATRTAYANAPRPFAIEGQPLSVGADVLASGEGEWTAFTVIDAEGRSSALYGPYLTEPGWQRVEVAIPQTLAFPISISRFTVIETKADRSYRASTTIDDLSVQVAPSVRTPPAERVTDDVVVTDGTLGTDGRWRFAVVSDAQFTAANQSLVPAARRTLREAVAADPDFVVINGDFIDTAYPEDLALARKVIEEELEGKVPWYYVPGNHEIYGPGTIAPFEAEFGPAQHSFVHQGTRFVLLDSSTGTLSGGGFEQWQLLDEALDDARENPDVNGVVAMWHHPPRDPSPLKASQLANRYEAEVVEDLLADFRAETGKGAAFIGSHVGAFSAASVDGVPYVINGNMGKAPSTDPADGGFAGWSLVGIDPDAAVVPADERGRWHAAPAQPWVQVEMRATVDELTLDAPAELAVGATAQVEATVTQGERSFPVGYPVGADWSGARVSIGEQRPGREAVVTLDPATGELTALRPGTATLSVTVNGVTERAEVTVTG
uniref:phosphodiester glycosidase family protein n=1 Tax=Desertihabitans aurantiacus TaxID=2282477 RepID=UPI000DF786A9